MYLKPENKINQLIAYFNQMYQNEVTPMPGAQTPGGQEGFIGGGMPEPMAANAFGGGFSNW